MFLSSWISIWHWLYGQPKPKLPYVSKGSPSAAQVTSQGSIHLPTTTTEVINKTVSNLDSGGVPSMAFSEAQCQKLMQMIQSGMRTNNSSNNRNLHSNSFSHMAGNITSHHFASPLRIKQLTTSKECVIDSIQNVIPIHITILLPNGETVPISHIRNVSVPYFHPAKCSLCSHLPLQFTVHTPTYIPSGCTISFYATLDAGFCYEKNS